MNFFTFLQASWMIYFLSYISTPLHRHGSSNFWPFEQSIYNPTSCPMPCRVGCHQWSFFRKSGNPFHKLLESTIRGWFLESRKSDKLYQPEVFVSFRFLWQQSINMRDELHILIAISNLDWFLFLSLMCKAMSCIHIYEWMTSLDRIYSSHHYKLQVGFSDGYLAPEPTQVPINIVNW